MSSKQVVGAVALVAALGGIVGGFAYASQPVTHEAPMVVVPAAQVVPSPTTSATASPTSVPTVTATQPAPVVTVAPKVVAPAPVQSAAPAPAPVQTQTVKRYTVSAAQPAADPAPVDPQPAQATRPAYNVPRPPLPPGTTEAPNLPNETPTPKPSN